MNSEQAQIFKKESPHINSFSFCIQKNLLFPRPKVLVVLVVNSSFKQNLEPRACHVWSPIPTLEMNFLAKQSLDQMTPTRPSPKDRRWHQHETAFVRAFFFVWKWRTSKESRRGHVILGVMDSPCWAARVQIVKLGGVGIKPIFGHART